MKKFELLEHTADIRIHATGDSKKELFVAALEGLCEIMTAGEKKKGDNTHQYSFEIDSIDLSALLVDFLSEALSIMQTYGVVVIKVDIDKLTNEKITGIFRCVLVNEFNEDVKAVTYNDLEVSTNEKDEYDGIVVLDL